MQSTNTLVSLLPVHTGRSIGAAESPDHWMICGAYLELRQGINPELVQRDRPGFLRAVIEKRKGLEKKLRKELGNNS